ncbi:uncharacterized protein Dvar_10940 [Desulfosarcina variabilis str. Montpellier]|uniref:hypothetical protein n=1 Tax=Desulfosarcina variabilis TaxID=2300 RepID=UPI003AFA3D8A
MVIRGRRLPGGVLHRSLPGPASDYKALEHLLKTVYPVIIAHPMAFSTNLNRVPPECLIEINNRYVWRSDWKPYYTPLSDVLRSLSKNVFGLSLSVESGIDCTDSSLKAQAKTLKHSGPQGPSG